MEDEVVKFPVCFKLYERRGFSVLLFYSFSLCECMWHEHVCVCGVGMEPREGWWVSCYTILDNTALGLGF